ncbi:MAG: hypothetical protein MUD10_01190 [Candidatus Pacebacteria bacterium]|jgi:hypothetical protein|nr:hypothetical protein [Candidatus Paceibacterota bacterium]
MFAIAKRPNFRFVAKLSFLVGFTYCAILVLFALVLPLGAILDELGVMYQANPLNGDNYTFLGFVVLMIQATVILMVVYSGLGVSLSGLLFGVFGLRSDKSKVAKTGIALSLIGLVITLFILAYYRTI